jgi:hypothetical protein
MKAQPLNVCMPVGSVLYTLLSRYGNDSILDLIIDNVSKWQMVWLATLQRKFSYVMPTGAFFLSNNL